MMNKRLLMFLVLLLWAVMLPTATVAQVVVEKSTEIVEIGGKQYYMHHVKKGETLYSIAKVYEVEEEELKKLNPEIEKMGLQVDMVIGVPMVVNEKPFVTPANQDPPKTEPKMEPKIEPVPDTIKPAPAAVDPRLANLPLSPDDEICDGYVIHTVKEAEKTRRLLRRWDVTEEEFRQLNPSVGSRVFVGQKVLIPVPFLSKNDIPAIEMGNDTIPADTLTGMIGDQLVSDSLVKDTIPDVFVLPAEKPESCYESEENAHRLYHVTLMVPLYLDDIDRLDLSKGRIERTKSTKSLKFLQFYEGFMMAVDSLTSYYGLNLELSVFDVHEDVSTAQAAMRELENEEIDLIVGPFFSKSFALVQEFAQNRGILIVNPMSERESILENADNVVKLKPNERSMVSTLADLIQIKYPKAKVTLIVENRERDSAMVNLLERTLEEVVSPEVTLTNEEMIDLIGRESQRRKMGKRVLTTLEVEGQIFSTKSLYEDLDGESYFENHFQSLSFSELEEFRRGLSSARDNILIAYGKDIVFATKILNTVNKSTKAYPITLIGLPNWSEFDNLLVPNLLNMNAIYFNSHFVDFNDSTAYDFIEAFRTEYGSEPIDYAYEGYDVAWYFLNALMRFGPNAAECLPYYHPRLLQARYYFTKKRYEDGLENRYWNMYQYDNNLIELKPVRIYPEE